MSSRRVSGGWNERVSTLANTIARTTVANPKQRYTLRAALDPVIKHNDRLTSPIRTDLHTVSIGETYGSTLQLKIGKKALAHNHHLFKSFQSILTKHLRRQPDINALAGFIAYVMISRPHTQSSTTPTLTTIPESGGSAAAAIPTQNPILQKKLDDDKARHDEAAALAKLQADIEAE